MSFPKGLSLVRHFKMFSSIPSWVLASSACVPADSEINRGVSPFSATKSISGSKGEARKQYLQSKMAFLPTFFQCIQSGKNGNGIPGPAAAKQFSGASRNLPVLFFALDSQGTGIKMPKIDTGISRSSSSQRKAPRRGFPS